MTQSVSVVIPAYNRVRTIRRAIVSVLTQTIAAEIIVVDDCSTDGTPEAVEGFMSDSIRLVRHTERLGASAARNTGVLHAESDRIAFLDSDDEWMSDYLAAQTRTLEAVDASVTGFRVLGPGRRRRDGVPRGLDVDGLSAILRNRHGELTSSCIAVRRSVFDTGVRFDVSLPSLQDLDFVAQVVGCGAIAINRNVLVRKYTGSTDRVFSGRNVYLGRERFMEKWETQIQQLDGAWSRQLRLLLLAAQSTGTEADVEQALSRLKTQNRQEWSLTNTAAIASSALAPRIRRATGRLINAAENATFDGVRTRVVDIAASFPDVRHH
jgi:glycosyltransferase involved in cell wall biosynthesis